MALSWPDLGWVDWVLVASLAASVVIGLVRGLLFECLSLAGWVVAWFAAQWGSPLLAAQLPFGTPGSALNLGAAFLLAFLCALVLWALMSRLLRLLIQATPLSIPDRLLGAVFGALRGAVLLLAVATVVGLTPASQSQAWRGSRGAQWLGAALAQLKPLLPEPMARLVRT
jgi:membrane protein required for colicin V production